MEAALAHVVRSKVEAACARSDLFEKRRTLMESGRTTSPPDGAAIARTRQGWRSRAPRPRHGGRERVVSRLSSNGRPGTRQGIRTPHPGAVLPVDAYSLAVACGSRGVSPDIWPASLSAPAVPRVVRLPDTTGTAPRPARHVAPRPDCRHAGPLPGRHGLSAPRRSSWPSVVRLRPRYREYGVRCLCDASTAYAAASQRGTGSALGAAITRRALRPGNVACGDSDCGAP